MILMILILNYLIGCGSKIGRKIAIAFARLDFNIALVDFNIKQTEFVADECQEASSKNRVVSISKNFDQIIKD